MFGHPFFNFPIDIHLGMMYIVSTTLREDNRMDKATLINEILQNCKANNVPTTGDLFFGLAFRTIDELKAIAKELQINY
jgi:hypothetical protein